MAVVAWDARPEASEGADAAAGVACEGAVLGAASCILVASPGLAAASRVPPVERSGVGPMAIAAAIFRAAGGAFSFRGATTGDGVLASLGAAGVLSAGAPAAACEGGAGVARDRGLGHSVRCSGNWKTNGGHTRRHWERRIRAWSLAALPARTCAFLICHFWYF